MDRVAAPLARLTIRRARLKVEVARSHWRLMLGLMFRRTLAPGTGLLLCFGRPADHGIHMRFVRFPLDAVFIRSDGTVARIRRAVPGQWGLWAGEPVRYVLEVPAGFARRHGLRRGDRVTLPRTVTGG